MADLESSDGNGRLVLEGVPRVTFEVQDGKVELTPFPSSLKASLEFLGQDCGYDYLMGTSGAAFRLLWKPGWHPDNVDIMVMAEEQSEPFRRAFEAVGRTYEMVSKRQGCDNQTHFRERIITSIRDERRPVLGFGVVGPPECSIIAGFDKGGDVLIGWSYFQGFPDADADLAFEPSGYFRKRDWFEDTSGLIIIGENREKPSREEIYRESLRWALEVVRTPEVRGRHSGLAAYTAWAEALLRDEDFPVYDLAILDERMMSHDDNMMTVAEGRWNASRYLARMAGDEPAMAEHLFLAASCYAAEHDLMWKGWTLVGGIGRSEGHVRRLAEPEVRQQIVPLILQARDKDAGAAEHIERALTE